MKQTYTYRYKLVDTTTGNISYITIDAGGVHYCSSSEIILVLSNITQDAFMLRTELEKTFDDLSKFSQRADLAIERIIAKYCYNYYTISSLQ